MRKEAAEVIEFWREIGPDGWFKRDDEIDARIVDRFGGLHERAVARKLEDWRGDAMECLALIIVIDQFSRNMFRDDPRAFAADEYAAEIAAMAIADGHDRAVDEELLPFLYMPFMHSESIVDQRRCVALMHAGGHPDNLKYGIIHRDVIARFGRFPHRNPVLGRHTTPAEQAYLDDGGFSG